MRTLVWIRGKDLRLTDHSPLLDAIGKGEMIALFVLDPYFFAPARAQRIPHRMQFLLESLTELRDAFAAKGGRLLIAQGPSLEVIPELARRFAVDRVIGQRWVEPIGRKRDAAVAERLHVPFELFEGEMLTAPGTVRTGSGSPYSVFTPFARAFRASVAVAALQKELRKLPPPPPDVTWTDAPIPTLNELGIAHNPNVIRGGERAARARLRTFLNDRLSGYEENRDRMDLEGTSRLSADLKFGTLSVRTVWNAVQACPVTSTRDKFLTEILWREFAHDMLWNRPELLEEPFRKEFNGFPWSRDNQLWAAWAEGKTGYPVVDAAARQLLQEGFVHNRARMISASFLTKHLLIDYRLGEQHYLKYLVDGDWAQNNMGWQWSAGCGADAQPYFRVFNPITQGRDYDPEGKYVRRYVPELASVPLRYLFEPWKAPAGTLGKFKLGTDYPEPIVEHSAARTRFLALAEQWLKRGER